MHAAAAIIPIPRENMHVQMRHDLPGCSILVPSNVKAVWLQHVLDTFHGPLHAAKESVDFPFRQVKERFRMGFGNDDRMPFGMGLDVQKSKRVFIFKDFFAGDFSFANSAEDAGCTHGSKEKVSVYVFCSSPPAESLNIINIIIKVMVTVRTQVKELLVQSGLGVETVAGDFMDKLDEKVRQLVLDAAKRAKENSRRTVMGRDL